MLQPAVIEDNLPHHSQQQLQGQPQQLLCPMLLLQLRQRRTHPLPQCQSALQMLHHQPQTLVPKLNLRLRLPSLELGLVADQTQLVQHLLQERLVRGLLVRGPIATAMKLLQRVVTLQMEAGAADGRQPSLLQSPWLWVPSCSKCCRYPMDCAPRKSSGRCPCSATCTQSTVQSNFLMPCFAYWAIYQDSFNNTRQHCIASSHMDWQKQKRS